MSAAISIRKQPTGLYNLFFVELWERYGFYTIQALIVLFLTKAWQLPDSQAYDIYSAFSALIYATPVIGGYLADRLLGFRHAIILGGILYAIGYFTLSTANHNLFYPALALLICGNGFFKGCVSSLVGTLYEENDPRRDSGFTIFYMGINIGSFLAPIISTWVANTYGWGFGFGTAGIGILIGLILAFVGFKRLGNRGLPPDPAFLKTPVFLGLSRQLLAYAGIVAAFAIITVLLHHANIVNKFLLVFSILITLTVLLVTFRNKGQQRNKLLVLVILIIFSILYWALYFQMFSSVTLFNDRVLDRVILGHEIPASMFTSVEAFFILVMSPIFAVTWLKLWSKQPSGPTKFALGIIFTSLFFLTLAVGTHFLNAKGLMPVGWSILSYFFQTCGELCLSPIGLSLITTLAPANLTGMMMGVWFLSFTIAFAIGDYIAKLTSIPTSITNTGMIAHIYSHVFYQLTCIGIIISLVLLMCTPRLKRLLNS